MSKFRSIKSLVAIASVVGLTSTSLAATTATVPLGGTVTTTLAVTSTTASGASTLSLASGAQIVKVADISLTTNNDQGLTLTASSGNLTKTGGIAIAYQVTSVADAAVAPTTFAVTSGTNYTVGTTAAGTSAVDLYIKYTPGATQDPGTYAGEITLTVTDNP